jgi:hypothetical protein
MKKLALGYTFLLFIGAFDPEHQNHCLYPTLFSVGVVGIALVWEKTGIKCLLGLHRKSAYSGVNQKYT